MGFGNHTSNYFHAVLLQYFTSELVLWVSCSVHCHRDHHGCGGGGGGGGVEVFTGHLHPNKSDAFPVAFPRVVIAAWSLLVSQARGRLRNFLWPLQSYCAGSWEFSLHSCDHIIIIIIIKIIKLNLSLSSLWTTYYHYHHYRVDVQLLKKTLWPKPSLLWLESSVHSFPSR